MTELRKDLPPLPRRMVKMSLDDRGYPVPYFVEWIDGVPDFRVIDSRKLRRCMRHRRCWLCGEPLGRYEVFVIGPMCAVNRVTSEPPSHRDCAEFAVRACPFLVRPQCKYRDRNLPEDVVDAAGVPSHRNPGATLLWITEHDRWRPFRPPDGGILFNVGEPVETLWFAEGRIATYGEILASIDSGLPVLYEMATMEGSAAVAALTKQVAAVMQMIEPLKPAEESP